MKPPTTPLAALEDGTESDRLPDAFLMAAVRAGDTGRLEELFRRHHRSVFGFLRRSTGSAEAAEDLTQEVFLRVLRYRSSFDAAHPFRSWLFRIARNLLFDRSARGRRGPTLGSEVSEAPDRSASPAEALEAKETLARVERSLESLSAEQRDALLLARFHDLSYRQIGEILDCSEGAVKARVFRALQAIGRDLAAQEGVKP